MNNLRSAVRPIITFGFSVLVAVMFYQGKSIPNLLQITWLCILGEWFGERLLFKLLTQGKVGG